MNIEILAPYCTTAKQQKLLEKVRKKLSLKSSKDLQTVVELVECLFVSKQYEGLLAFLPEVLAVPFAANFNLWYPIERSFRSSPKCLPSQQNIAKRVSYTLKALLITKAYLIFKRYMITISKII